MTPPTIGRIVHYVSVGAPDERETVHRAAIITDIEGPSVYEDDVIAAERNAVSLCIFMRSGFAFARDVPEDQTAQKLNTWHWPERTS